MLNAIVEYQNDTINILFVFKILEQFLHLFSFNKCKVLSYCRD